MALAGPISTFLLTEKSLLSVVQPVTLITVLTKLWKEMLEERKWINKNN